jgi:hypothetical protein
MQTKYLCPRLKDVHSGGLSNFSGDVVVLLGKSDASTLDLAVFQVILFNKT